MKPGFRTSALYEPTQTNFCTGGQIRTKIIPANFGVSRFIGLGAVGGAFLDFAFKTYMAYNNLPCTTVQACDSSVDVLMFCRLAAEFSGNVVIFCHENMEMHLGNLIVNLEAVDLNKVSYLL
jgi:hypothetical protein